jgi:hypothetical protein
VYDGAGVTTPCLTDLKIYHALYETVSIEEYTNFLMIRGKIFSTPVQIFLHVKNYVMWCIAVFLLLKKYEIFKLAPDFNLEPAKHKASAVSVFH